MSLKPKVIHQNERYRAVFVPGLKIGQEDKIELETNKGVDAMQEPAWGPSAYDDECDSEHKEFLLEALLKACSKKKRKTKTDE